MPHIYGSNRTDFIPYSKGTLRQVTLFTYSVPLCADVPGGTKATDTKSPRYWEQPCREDIPCNVTWILLSAWLLIYEQKKWWFLPYCTPRKKNAFIPKIPAIWKLSSSINKTSKTLIVGICIEGGALQGWYRRQILAPFVMVTRVGLLCVWHQVTWCHPLPPTLLVLWWNLCKVSQDGTVIVQSR